MARPGVNIIDALREIQRRIGWLTPEALRSLSEDSCKPLHELHGVASFYPEFHLSAPPRVQIEVCNALPCQMRGAERLFQAISSKAKGQAGVEVRRCPCLGACDEAPAAVIQGQLQVCQRGEDARDLYKIAYAAIHGVGHVDARYPIGIAGNFRTDPYAAADDHYGQLKALIDSFDPPPDPNEDEAARQAKREEARTKARESVLAAIGPKGANLRGMGGSGKEVLRKWTQTITTDADQKYVVCNADESEPGTLKDREIMRNIPHLLIEGMIIGALTVGATHGYIYLRHEYKAQRIALDDALARVRRFMHKGHPLLGDNVGGSGRSFHLEIFVSPGGYIMGEITALLEALEGKRGQPRNQKSDAGDLALPSIYGLWGKPTLVQNVETWTLLPAIMQWHTAERASAYDDDGQWRQFKWASVCGDVCKPGVFEVPMGTTYRQLIEMAGGVDGELKAFAPSGPSFGFVPPGYLDEPLSFEREAKVPAGSAAVIVLNRTRCMLDATLNFTRFFRNESCGKCVPCRLGTQKLVDLLKLARDGKRNAGGCSTERLIADVNRLEQVLTDNSICGLGKYAPKSVKSLLKHWPDEVKDHFERQYCAAGYCPGPEKEIIVK